jgi:hypothetical protein
MISPKITISHSIGRAARANIGRDSRLFGNEGRPVEGIYYPYLPVKVPPNKLLQYTAVIPNVGYKVF